MKPWPSPEDESAYASHARSWIGYRSVRQGDLGLRDHVSEIGLCIETARLPADHWITHYLTVGLQWPAD